MTVTSVVFVFDLMTVLVYKPRVYFSFDNNNIYDNIVCLQVFTSIFALNGHIRVHGGRSVIS